MPQKGNVLLKNRLIPDISTRIILNSNLPEKHFQMLKNKVKIDELLNDSTDIF